MENSMNITLSADEDLVRKAREYAVRHGTSLNQIIREYMEQLARVADTEKNADEFERLAKDRGGLSHPDFVFDREEAHKRR
jgi:hypothetical protein